MRTHAFFFFVASAIALSRVFRGHSSFALKFHQFYKPVYRQKGIHLQYNSCS
jgi:hypothetical protein